MRRFVLPVTMSLSLSLGCASAPDNENPNLVDSDVAGRLLPRVELKRCQPSTEVGPTVRRGRLPKYPAAEFYNDKPGEVVLRFDVTESGTTDNIEVVRSTSESFMIQAGAAVEEWRFKPATNEGVPIRVTCTQRYGFEVQY